MNTIGAVGYERQPEMRQVAPAKGPFDRERDRHGRRDRDRDSAPADDAPADDVPAHDASAHSAPGWGTTPGQNVAGRLHKVNITA
jgi:hypothetical protein